MSRDNYTEVAGNVQQPVTSGYEPKPEPSHAIPEIAPGLVRRGIEHISNLDDDRTVPLELPEHHHDQL
eukprot:2220698-Amphidinium_carterae.2